MSGPYRLPHQGIQFPIPPRGFQGTGIPLIRKTVRVFIELPFHCSVLPLPTLQRPACAMEFINCFPSASAASWIPDSRLRRSPVRCRWGTCAFLETKLCSRLGSRILWKSDGRPCHARQPPGAKIRRPSVACTGFERTHLGGHHKTGQPGTPQNQPVDRVQDSHIFTLTTTFRQEVF